MGDSYAVGIGAGIPMPKIGPRYYNDLCYRFKKSYGMQTQDLAFNKTPVFNYPACSGNKFDEIVKWQLRDTPGGHLGAYYPSWGRKPRFVTLSMGGNDINIVTLVMKCILNINTRAQSSCDDQLKLSNKKLQGPQFTAGAENVLRSTIKKARNANISNFRIYLLGYAKFFNSETTQCNNVSFQPSWIVKSNGAPSVLLTQNRRRKMNMLALGLNQKLRSIALAFPEVTYVDYDAHFEGHRFCDRREPNANDPETWFFNHNTTQDSDVSGSLQNSYLLNSSKLADILQSAGYIDNDNPENGFGKSITSDAEFIQDLSTAAASHNDTESENLLWQFVRVMHPKIRGHWAIKNVLVEHLARN
ncbi:MAG: hypothetical protein Q9167_002803 [Letrouitia subvulpina]